MPLPSLTPNVNLNENQSISAPFMNGASWGGFGTGDWVVNVPTSAGSGLSLQGGAGSTSTVLILAAAGAALWFVLRMKGK